MPVSKCHNDDRPNHSFCVNFSLSNANAIDPPLGRSVLGVEMFGFGRKTRRSKESDALDQSADDPGDAQTAVHRSAYCVQASPAEPPGSEEALFLDEVAEVVTEDGDGTEPYSTERAQEISEMQNDLTDGGHTELAAVESPNTDKAILHIGPGTVLKGDITTCESLVVQGNLNGTVEASLMLLAQGGVVDGTVNVQTAEIEGTFTGTLTVKGLLAVKGGGQIQGTVRYGELEIERGCQLNGDISQHDGTSSAQNAGAPISRVAGGNPAGVKAA